jgi:hypothetical protein
MMIVVVVPGGEKTTSLSSDVQLDNAQIEIPNRRAAAPHRTRRILTDPPIRNPSSEPIISRTFGAAEVVTACRPPRTNEMM